MGEGVGREGEKEGSRDGGREGGKEEGNKRPCLKHQKELELYFSLVPQSFYVKD
jgi:hypothetical protein